VGGMSDKAMLKLVAMVCITLLELGNLATYGVDGALFGLVVAAISGLAGYQLGKVSRKR